MEQIFQLEKPYPTITMQIFVQCFKEKMTYHPSVSSWAVGHTRKPQVRPWRCRDGRVTPPSRSRTSCDSCRQFPSPSNHKIHTHVNICKIPPKFPLIPFEFCKGVGAPVFTSFLSCGLLSDNQYMNLTRTTKRQNTQITQNTKKQNMALVNNTTDTLKKPRLRESLCVCLLGV